MVRQDDEPVRPRRLFGRLDERGDRLVDAVERLERLDALRPAVVGELVVVGEVGIDDVRAAIHLLDDQRHVDVAQDDVAGGPHPGVLETAMHLRADAGASRAAGLVLLLDDLAEEHRERPEIAGRAEEERHERLAVADPATLGLDRRRRQVRPRRIAGQQVADAGAVVRQQALAVRDARHDQRRVDRVARRHQVLAVAFVPAEGRDAVVVAVEDAGLAARCHRRQDRLPLRQLVAAVADHAGHRVDRSGAHPTGQDRVGEAVDLDDHEARLVGVALRALDEQSLDEEPVIGAAAVDAEDRGQDRVDDGVDERGDEGGPEPVDVHARRPLDDDDERDDLEHQDQDPDEDERDWRGEREDDRADGCVEQGEKDDGQRGAREAVDGETRHQPGGHQERDDRDRERQDQPAHERPRTTAPLPEHAQLGPVEADQSAHGRVPPSVAASPALTVRQG